MFETENKIILNNPNDLNRIKNYLVNFKLEKDSTAVHESLSIAIYLISLSKISTLSFPITITKRESPDFLYSDSNINIGIEHSISTIEQYKIALKELSKMPVGSNLELSFYSPFNRVKNKNSSIGIRQPNEKLIGLGYHGDSAEREWAEIISTSISKKTKLLNKEFFRKYDYNELIIEDESPVDFILEFDEAISLLKKQYQVLEKSIIYYDKIHIFTCNTFIYDVFESRRFIDVRKRSIKN